jgi:hypothetical protein
VLALGTFASVPAVPPDTAGTITAATKVELAPVSTSERRLTPWAKAAASPAARIAGVPKRSAILISPWRTRTRIGAPLAALTDVAPP